MRSKQGKRASKQEIEAQPTLSISCLLALLPCLLRISKKGQTSISKEGCLKHQRCLKEMLAYGYKQA
jgi:hypothetical protein